MILFVEIFSLDIEFCFFHGADFAADSGAARDRWRERGRERETHTDARERGDFLLQLCEKECSMCAEFLCVEVVWSLVARRIFSQWTVKEGAREGGREGEGCVVVSEI
jgi:hypothetical protein